MDQKIRGLLAYLFSWIGGLVVLVGFKDNTKETNFNAAQSIVLGVLFFAIRMVISIIVGILTGIVLASRGGFGFFGFISGVLGFIGGILNIVFIILTIIGMVRAYQESEYNIPLVSDLTKKIFKNKVA